jgi:hypothetical protein
MGSGKTNITRLPEPTPADALRVRALNADLRCIRLSEGCSRLVLACSVQRFILVGLRLESHDTGLLLGPRTLGALRTGRAILPGKAHLPCHAILRIGIGEPGDTLLTHPATRVGLGRRPRSKQQSLQGQRVARRPNRSTRWRPHDPTG